MLKQKYYVVWKGRKTLMDPDKEKFAVDTAARTLDEVIEEVVALVRAVEVDT